MKTRRAYSQSSWCFLRTAPNLRAAVIFRMKQLGIRSQDVAREAGVRSDRLSSYLRGMHKPLTQYQLIQLCKYLGIEVDLKVSFSEELYPEHDKLKEIYLNSKPT